MVKSVGEAAHVPVYGPSLTSPQAYALLGDVSGTMDLNNLHDYWSGHNPETGGWGPPDSKNNYYGSLPYDLDMAALTGPGKPVVQTETGYTVSNTPYINLITESVEAVYEPRMLLHSWNSGVRRSYTYELMADPSSPPGIGLTHSDLTPRPAFTALANLISLLKEPQGNYPTQTLTYSLSGDTAGVETSLLQKQDGSFWLAAWLSGSIYDVTSLAATPLTPKRVNLAISGGLSLRNVWRFDTNGNVVSTSQSGSSMSLNVGSAVTIVKIQ